VRHAETFMLLFLVVLTCFTIPMFCEEKPGRYADRMDARLRDVETHLADVELFAGHDQGGIMYVIRVQRDVELCRTVLAAYRKGRCERKHVEQFFRHLDKDINDYPWVGAAKATK
jgi:hypothetical protein